MSKLTPEVAELVKAGNELERIILYVEDGYLLCSCRICRSDQKRPTIRRWRAAVKVVEGRDG